MVIFLQTAYKQIYESWDMGQIYSLTSLFPSCIAKYATTPHVITKQDGVKCRQ